MKVRAPATSANLGPGFDCFGLALKEPADLIEVERADELSIEVSGIGSRGIPEDPGLNTAGVVAREMLDGEEGVRISIEKGIRPSSGLGSSAASAAGAAVAIDSLFGLGYSDQELVELAGEGERAAAGEAHLDNVAPAVFGGFTIVDGDRVFGFEPPEMEVVAVLPEVEVSTSDARGVLPSEVGLGEAVENVASASLLAAGMVEGDLEKVGRGMRDVVVEPRRASLVPGFSEVREAAVSEGALGVALSGAGPSVLAVCEEGADRVGESMVEAFGEEGVGAESFVTGPGPGMEKVES